MPMATHAHTSPTGSATEPTEAQLLTEDIKLELRTTAVIAAALAGMESSADLNLGLLGVERLT